MVDFPVPMNPTSMRFFSIRDGSLGGVRVRQNQKAVSLLGFFGEGCFALNRRPQRIAKPGFCGASGNWGVDEEGTDGLDSRFNCLGFALFAAFCLKEASLGGVHLKLTLNSSIENTTIAL